MGLDDPSCSLERYSVWLACIKFGADPTTGREGIAIFSNFRKCALKHHQDCIKYGKTE